MLQSQLTDSAIRETLSEVFRQAAYSTSIQDTIGRRIWRWIWTLLQRFFDTAAQYPLVYQVARILLVLVIVAIIARTVYLAYERARMRAESRLRAAGGLSYDGMGDAWQLAQRYASEGRFTEAAHALYWHLLEWLSQREKIILHPSKTVGDYARELRARSSRQFTGYRDFARSYEVVIYGLGTCDRERFDRLLSLATAITRTNG